MHRKQTRDVGVRTFIAWQTEGLPNYPRDFFIDDLLSEHEIEVRQCLQMGAHKVQIDFTEARLAVKLDPFGGMLDTFIALNNLALARFSAEERQRIGVHTCPGADRDSTHSAEVDYADFLPSLFELNAGNFYIPMAGEPDRARALKIIRDHMRPDQKIFVGVVAPIDPRIETPEQIRDRVLEAAENIPVEQLGTTDDCGFSPFSDDTSTTRDTAFAKFGRACLAPLSRRKRSEGVSELCCSPQRSASFSTSTSLPISKP